MSEKTEITLDMVTDAYIKTRDQIAALNKEIDRLKEFQSKREEWMNNYLVTNKLTNAKTDHGTVYTVRKESVTVGNWDEFFKWVVDTKHEDFISKAAAKKAVLEYMGEDRATSVPGLNYVAIRTVGVKRS